MNFTFQSAAFRKPGNAPGGRDYSRAVDGALPIPLDERSLDECVGIGGGLGFGAIDWNGNGVSRVHPAADSSPPPHGPTSTATAAA